MIVLHNSNLTVFSFSTLRILLYSFLASIVATENFAVSLIAIFFFGVFYFFFFLVTIKDNHREKCRNSGIAATELLRGRGYWSWKEGGMWKAGCREQSNDFCQASQTVLETSQGRKHLTFLSVVMV